MTRWRALGPLRPAHDKAISKVRDRVLHSARWFPEPDCTKRWVPDVPSLLDDGMGTLSDDLDRYGIAVVGMDGPVSDEDLIAFARRLGVPEPERDGAVQAFVAADVILDMRPVTDGQQRDLQPFSPRPLTLHVEGTRRPSELRYRYLVFEYREMPSPEHGGQTILLPIADVVACLGPELSLGRGIALHAPATGPIVSERAGRTIISYRDHYDDPVDGFTDLDGLTSADACEFMHLLTVSLYQPEQIRGLHPRSHQIVVLDNTRFFHGRTAHAVAETRRLRRIRVLDPGRTESQA